LLQGEVTRLLGRAGMRRPRDRKLAALTAVSALFALHHVGPAMPAGVFASVLVYSFAISLLLGFLFDLTGNLAVCSFAHLFNNVMVLRLGPSLAAPEQVEAFGDGVYVAAYLLVAFSFLFLMARDSSASLRPIRP
jgi:membrane protease YdiL (CAAX protease family)